MFLKKEMLENVKAYCMKCKKSVDVKNVTRTAKMLKGNCSDCNTKVCRFIGKSVEACGCKG